MHSKFPIFALALTVLTSSIAVNSWDENQAEQAENPQTQDEPKHSNALVKETSPYLLMHAHNPVNWYGWSAESLSLAKETNKPIFLSIGYSSCHWCHVMERESFLDDEIAQFLNDNFICIKVDREERPDVDAIYMESLRVVNRRTNGGWPLSMFLTPDAKPFFGGTYFPARDGDRGVRFGFLTIVKRVHDAWKNNTDKINEDAKFVAETVQKRLAGQKIDPQAKIDPNWITRCKGKLTQNFDPNFGGFGYIPHDPNRPKFPEPSNLLFLIDVLKNESDNENAKKQLVMTAERMMMGGILDHLGGGFHRYSVDRYWRIPHFEKMLYDNAQLAIVYSELYRFTAQPEFKMVVDELLEFVSREMKDKNGGFYSALDAESEGEEGKFYRWSKEELMNLLTENEFKLFAQVYGINQEPNFEGKFFVPQLNVSFDSKAAEIGISKTELLKRLKPIRNKVFDVRVKRPRPITDTKILASWNGMMIRGFADSGRILKNDTYIAIAEKAANFVMENMLNEKGRLYRTYTEGEAKLNAYLPDYADVIDGLLSLHQATGKQNWLDSAVQLQRVQDDLFWDEQNGGYFYTSKDHQQLLARAKRSNDGPVPSGNSVSTGNLIYLAKVLGEESYREKAKRTALTSSVLLEQFPTAAPRLLIHTRQLAPAN